MALAPKRSTEAVNVEANEVGALLDGGYLRIYDGTKPASADDGVGAAVLLATLRWGNPAFAAASAGVANALAITPDVADAAGTATWFRGLQADGTTKVLDGTVGATSGFDLILTAVDLAIGINVVVDDYAYVANRG